MKYCLVLSMAAMLPLLCGCLEVEQYPAWRGGEYDGKPDQLQHQVHFHNDRLAWMGAIINRNHLQDEYSRTHP